MQLLTASRDAEIEQRAWERWLMADLASHFSKDAKIMEFETMLSRIKGQQNQATAEEYDSIVKKAETTKARHQKTMKR